jgi:hypothetical protein
MPAGEIQPAPSEGNTGTAPVAVPQTAAGSDVEPAPIALPVH